MLPEHLDSTQSWNHGTTDHFKLLHRLNAKTWQIDFNVSVSYLRGFKAVSVFRCFNVEVLIRSLKHAHRSGRLCNRLVAALLNNTCFFFF